MGKLTFCPHCSRAVQKRPLHPWAAGDRRQATVCDSNLYIATFPVVAAPSYMNLPCLLSCTLDMVSHSHRKMKQALQARKRSAQQLKAVDNLVDLVWHQDPTNRMPALPTDPVFIHPIQFAGRSVSRKLEALAAQMMEEGIDRMLLTALDDIAWLLNLRGSDVPYNPLFVGYCIATSQATATLFIEDGKVGPEVQQYLTSANVAIRPYSQVCDALADESQGAVECSYDPAQCNQKLYEVLAGNDTVDCSARPSLVTSAKGVKNECELQGMRDCHLRDAVALVRYFKWLEDRVSAGDVVTEISGAEQATLYRSQEDHFMGLSFECVSAVGANASIIHYHPSRACDRPITRDEVYLFDSGAQYLDGTTDVCRTLHFGRPSTKEVEAFTRALKGHLAVRMATFPDTITGHQLDSWARAALWAVGWDYSHGTGHGVGCCLNVHEGPHGIGTRPGDAKLRAGAITSNEPGYYEDGAFGVRIENVCVVREVATKYCMPGTRSLGLEDLTMVPIEAKLVDVALLTAAEVQTLNAYHAEVLHRVGPLVRGHEGVYEWLERVCQPLSRGG